MDPARQRNGSLSIGLLLALHEGATDAIDLNAFRASLLEPSIGLKMPAAFDRVGDHWRIYQAHAYATFALEVLLSAVLLRGTRLQFLHGDELTLDLLTSDLFKTAAEESGDSPCANWWDLDLGVVRDLV